MLKVLIDGAIRQEKGIKVIQTGKERKRLLSAEDMLLYTKDSKNPTRKFL